MTIYVGNLSLEVVESDLNELFSQYGPVKSVHVPIDRQTGKKRGFAFVEMRDQQQEEDAIAALDGAELEGRQLKVNPADPTRDSRDRRY